MTPFPYRRRIATLRRAAALVLALGIAAAPLVAGEPKSGVFSDDFETGECSMWSASSNPLAAPDADGDTYGDLSQPTVICQLPEGFVFDLGDCDDGQSSVHPGAFELCDGADNDCEPTTPNGQDEAWYGLPCDGGDTDLCEEGTYSCVKASQFCNDSSGDDVEICNGKDDDCDGFIDEGCED